MLLAFTSVQAWATATAEQPDRNISEYNLDGDLAFSGFDPVSTFEEFGGEALEGDENITVEYGGVVYRFASEENKEAFEADPTRFEPTYGGWCAWGMANNSKIAINPQIFTQNENRMHYFISVGAKIQFDRQLERREKDADDNWTEFSGEEPRI